MNAAEVADVCIRYDAPLHRWLEHENLVPRSHIDDVVQETYVRMMRLARGEEIEDLGAFVFRVARNIAYEWNSRRGNSAWHSAGALEDLIDDIAIEDAALAEDERRVVRREIALLPPRQRQAVTLHIDRDLTYGQIAALLGVTNRIVLRDLTRAYATLRLALSQAVSR